ncbi:hypothetical protein ALMP_02380 [Streptomyces sp. A012304]|nr:hypothetical protein ALMP_02380 [Streptomyces sp. A012304]
MNSADPCAQLRPEQGSEAIPHPPLKRGVPWLGLDGQRTTIATYAARDTCAARGAGAVVVERPAVDGRRSGDRCELVSPEAGSVAGRVVHVADGPVD